MSSIPSATTTCPGCHALLRMRPSESSAVDFDCPDCGRPLRALWNDLGQPFVEMAGGDGACLQAPTTPRGAGRIAGASLLLLCGGALFAWRSTVTHNTPASPTFVAEHAADPTARPAARKAPGGVAVRSGKADAIATGLIGNSPGGDEPAADTPLLPEFEPDPADPLADRRASPRDALREQQQRLTAFWELLSGAKKNEVSTVEVARLLDEVAGETRPPASAEKPARVARKKSRASIQAAVGLRLIQFEQTTPASVRDLLSLVEELADTPIDRDPRRLGEHAAKLETKISLRVQRVTLHELLGRILNRAGLDFAVEEGRIVVLPRATPADASKQP